jgi:sortase A
MKNGKNKKLAVGGIILAVLGLAGFVIPFIYNLYSESYVPQVVFADVPTFEDQFIDTTSEFPISDDRPTATPDYNLSDIEDRLIIAKGNINMPVFLGADEKTLNKGGWLFPVTSRPDLGGNSVIFGHRFKYLPPISNTLYNLDKVEVGDEMILIWQGREYKYKVFDVKIIEPTDLSVIQPSSDSRLTVITCTPLWTTKQRLVITGSLM